MESLVAACGLSDYEDVRAKMSNLLVEKYKRKAGDLFIFEPIPTMELQEFQNWLLMEN
jgi:hypothetical protein